MALEVIAAILRPPIATAQSRLPLKAQFRPVPA